MAEPIQEQVMQAVDAAILDIDADLSGSPYFYTVTQNQYRRANVTMIESDAGPFPFVAVAMIDSRNLTSSAAGNNDHVFEEMEIEVGGWLGDRTNVQRNMARLEHDIRTALFENVYLGGLGIVWWTGTERVYPLNNEDRPLVVCHFTITYEVGLQDLTALIGS